MYFKQLISGLKYIHEEGVYHRDIKLENILFSEDLNLKISDFGLSIHKNEMKGKLTTKESAGTKNYWPPEEHYNLDYIPA